MCAVSNRYFGCPGVRGVFVTVNSKTYVHVPLFLSSPLRSSPPSLPPPHLCLVCLYLVMLRTHVGAREEAAEAVQPAKERERRKRAAAAENRLPLARTGMTGTGTGMGRGAGGKGEERRTAVTTTVTTATAAAKAAAGVHAQGRLVVVIFR